MGEFSALDMGEFKENIPAKALSAVEASRLQQSSVETL